MQRLPFVLSVYRFATKALSPAAPLLLKRRLKRGKEHAERGAERLGEASLARPEGRVIWVHGASVGECVAALPLIDELIKRTGAAVLVTSGTVTSAEVMKKRLPAGAFHQFVPVDTPSAVARFLDHWHPDIGLFVDSDMWPNLVLQAKARGVRLVLVNARMSRRSFESWRRAPVSAAALLSAFDACLAQDKEFATRFRTLKAKNVTVMGSLKADAPPLPADAGEVQALRRRIGRRPVLLAAQTHEGEEETILPAHDMLRARHPDLLTIIVPRHPARGADIAALCDGRPVARRSAGEPITAETAVYIADTIGELGLFYRLAPFAFVGGSLIPHGGQNPLEPAKLCRAVLAGPHTFNFKAAYAAIFAAQGFGLVTTSADIRDAAGALLDDPEGAEAFGKAASVGAEKLSGAVAATASFVAELLSDGGTANAGA